MVLDSDFAFEQPVPSLGALLRAHRIPLLSPAARDFVDPEAHAGHEKNRRSNARLLGSLPSASNISWTTSAGSFTGAPVALLNPFEPPYVFVKRHVSGLIGHMVRHHEVSSSDNLFRFLMQPKVILHGPLYFEVVTYHLFVLATEPHEYLVWHTAGGHLMPEVAAGGHTATPLPPRRERGRPVDPWTITRLRQKYQTGYLFNMPLSASERFRLGYYVGRPVHVHAEALARSKFGDLDQLPAGTPRCCWLSVHNDRMGAKPVKVLRRQLEGDGLLAIWSNPSHNSSRWRAPYALRRLLTLDDLDGPAAVDVAMDVAAPRSDRHAHAHLPGHLEPSERAAKASST
jgi:hypothetical protein